MLSRDFSGKIGSRSLVKNTLAPWITLIMSVVLLNEKMLPVPLSPILKDLSTYQFRQQQEAGIYQNFPSIVDNKLHMLWIFSWRVSSWSYSSPHRPGSHCRPQYLPVDDEVWVGISVVEPVCSIFIHSINIFKPVFRIFFFYFCQIWFHFCQDWI